MYRSNRSATPRPAKPLGGSLLCVVKNKNDFFSIFTLSPARAGGLAEVIGFSRAFDGCSPPVRVLLRPEQAQFGTDSLFRLNGRHGSLAAGDGTVFGNGDRQRQFHGSDVGSSDVCDTETQEGGIGGYIQLLAQAESFRKN